MPSNSLANHPEGREFDDMGNFLFLEAIKNGRGLQLHGIQYYYKQFLCA